MPKIPKNLKILLVEDDRIMRQIEIQALKNIGYTDIIEAFNGDEAITILQNQTGINLVISDWNMPKKGGFELLMWVRSKSEFKNLPFIMATGQADKQHEQQAVDAGVTEIIVKPFTDNELKLTIGRAFGIHTDEFQTLETIERVAASGKVKIKIAHIQITDHLVMGVLKHLMGKGELKANHFELELVCMEGWNPAAKALEKGVVDGACILAPLAIDLYNAGTDIRLVLLSHKNGSIFVRSAQKESNIDGASDKDDSYKRNNIDNDINRQIRSFFKNSSFLIPHKMSVHHILSHLVLTRAGLNPSMSKGNQYDMEFEVSPPINMPEFINKNLRCSGFMVAEPIGSLAVESKIAECQFLSGELWENHPCCAVVMQKDFIDKYTDAMFEFTKLLVKAGKFIAEHPDDAAQIAVQFLDPDQTIGFTASILKKVLTDPNGITTDDLYPVVADLDTMQHYMVKEMGIGSRVNIDDFVDLRFADSSCDMGLADYRPSVLHSSKEEVLDILSRSSASKLVDNIAAGNTVNEESRQDNKPLKDKAANRSQTSDIATDTGLTNEKPATVSEQKYLTFFLDREEYGISINNIREIIGMMPITHVPRTPFYVKGVINLRGKVIPVMDLRIKFGMEPVEYNDRTCILVVEIPSQQNSHNVHIGVVVDCVSEVINIKLENIEVNTKFGTSVDTDAILGIAKTGERVQILLDIETALLAETIKDQ